MTWSPEQQAALEQRWPDWSPENPLPRDQSTFQERWHMAFKPKPRSWKKQLTLFIMGAGVFLMLVGYANPGWTFGTAFSNDQTTAQPIYVYAVGWALVLGWGFVAVMFCWLRSYNKVLDVAMKPIPSIQEIDAELRQMGYDPSLQDVLLVEQRLKSERNEALVVTGVVLASAYAMTQTAKGKPIL